MLPSRVDKIALWKEHGERFTCNHEQSELRVRKVKGGGTQCVRQCLRCGSAASSSIKQEIAVAQNGGNPLPPFDERLQLSWESAQASSAERIRNADDSAFWKAYENYLTSAPWKKKRERVIKRASGICEGCGEMTATEVHHLSYAHVGNEYLFELVAVCESCHEKLHAEPT